MKISAKTTRTLIYYDGPVAFVAQDKVGTNYVCVLVDRGDAEDEFLAVPVSPQKLHRLVLGDHDLRELFEFPDNKVYYKIKVGDFRAENIDLTILPEDVNPEFFPLPGTFIAVGKAKPDSPVVAKEAVALNTAVIEFSLNPPEASDTTAIAVPTLANGLILFQSLLKYSYKSALKPLTKAVRKALDIADNYQSEVIGFAPGSFKVILKAKAQADLTGYVDMERALERLYDILRYADNVEKTTALLQESKGHLVANYLKLLEFIVKSNTPISMSWAVPNQQGINNISISKKQATVMYESLSRLTELRTEMLTFVGEFEKIDKRNNKWIVTDEEGNRVRGEISVKSKKSLNGGTVGVKKYRFEIEEKLEEVTATGREVFSRTLIDYEAID